MLRVLHVIAHLDRGGSELQLVAMLKAAHGVHWDATLCVLNRGYPLVEEVRAAGIPVVELEQRRRKDVRRIQAVRRLLREGGFDVVHATLWRGGLVTRLAASFSGRPAVVLSERAVEPERPRSTLLLDRALQGLTDHYVGNSLAVAGFICRAHGVGPDRVTVVHNGIDRSIFHAGDRSRSTAPANAIHRIGALGRLVTDKGYDILLSALPEVVRAAPVSLAIAGSGPEKARLVEMARGLPVEFVETLTTPAQVASFLRGLDLFVMPSRSEGFPNAVLEARACGVPLVATTVAGVAEAVAGQGRLVPPEDPTALAEAIVDALGSRRVPESEDIATLEIAAEGHLQVFEKARSRRDAR